MTVYSPEDFEKWQDEMHKRTSYAVEKENADLYWGWKWIANN